MPETSRLLVLAHGPTTAASAAVFGDDAPLLRPDRCPPMRSPPRSWSGGPEFACRQTVELLDPAAEVRPGLAGPDLGAWTGRTLADVAAADPEGLQAWLADPAACPHGGETLAGLVERMGAVLADDGWPAGTSGLVVTPLVARALVAAALGAPGAVLFGVNVGHGGRVLLSRSGPRWRLQELLRHPADGKR